MNLCLSFPTLTLNDETCNSWLPNQIAGRQRSDRGCPTPYACWFPLSTLPTTDGIPIPPGVDIQVVDPEAVANGDRMMLFIQLGAVEPSVADVRDSILAAYNSPRRRRDVDVAESRAHLHYLYLTHQPGQAQNDLEGIYIYSHESRFSSPRKMDFYLPGDDPYGPESLLGPTEDAPGLPVPFVHPTYLDDTPQLPTSTHPSWERWLHSSVGIRERLRLVSSSRQSLSDAWVYVAQHRPEKLLGLLEHLWEHEGSRVSSNEDLTEKIQSVSANKLCTRGSAISEYEWTLDETWLPFPHLQREYLRFMEEYEFFPFLNLDETISAEQLSAKWMFLHTDFSVGKDHDTTFLLDILLWINLANPDASAVSRPQRLLDLYIAIDAKCLGALDQQAERKQVRDAFRDPPGVFVPGHDKHDACWADPRDCRWEAPPAMRTNTSLKHVYAETFGANQMALVSRFFRETLSIPKASWTDLTKELKHLRAHKCEDFDRILDLYQYLNHMTLSPFTDELREQFETESLVFIHTDEESGWYKPSECLWSSTADIQGMVTLNDDYEELKDFFVDTLGVKTLTLQMVYDELLQLSPQQTADDVKRTVWSFNALLQTEPNQLDPERLRQAHVFPIRYPSGKRALGSADTDFAIVDREDLAARFRGRIKLLDYPLEEIRRLRPFLEWANLERRYLSACVKEIPSFSGGPSRRISTPNRDLKRKAHALLRIAATFNSPRYRADPAGLYRLFRAVQVLETNGISMVLTISQDGRAVNVDEAVGSMFIPPDGFTIYVPMDKMEQDFCFGSPLPTSLADWLMRDPVTSQIHGKIDNALVTALAMLLAVDVAVVDRVLDYQGIVPLTVAEEGMEVLDEDDMTEEDQMADDTEDTEEVSDEDETTDGDEEDADEADDQPHLVSRQVIARRSHMACRPAMPIPSHSAPVMPLQAHPPAEDVQYRVLLDRVVAAARKAEFPSRGAFGMSDILSALPGDEIARFDGPDAVNRFQSSSQFERDKKIGAAGELYVFEVLSGLDPPLPGWGRENWQSTMRRYVTIHPDYADMDAWSGRETADITYNDTESELTAMLINGGYLDADEWQDARPMYYIEVKSTTGPRETPFYMSKGQYKRVSSAPGFESPVYMIMRVSEIDSRPCMAVYLDPEKMRLERRLVFTAQTWSVIPGRGA
ncbi:hypothetical protein C8A01DRAFT_17707 [Parachaetomium inaequale]|uniref:Protein NO VEIN C-terminal domain-containing protein n=1 Tax=Parachaetomium inaequale TaxID=2588326 RepID=A0AAN6SQ96_9PEZI|nr:hypothetical protein C8A01DRAFT_17707 [Parachaetomium inaequale]